MANVAAPFGFQWTGTVDGAPSFRSSSRLIDPTNSTPIYWGDAVVPHTSVSLTGYIQQATASTVVMAGIFYGCQYFSISQRKLVNSRYWPGTTTDVVSGTQITAFVCDDPLAVFRVQAGGSNIATSALWENVQLNVGTGSTSTGFSGMYVESPANTSTLPFRIFGFPTTPPGANGTDQASAYNIIHVVFNNEVWKTGSQSIG